MKQMPGKLYVLQKLMFGTFTWGQPYSSETKEVMQHFLPGTIVLLVSSKKDERLCLVGENLFWFSHKALRALDP